MEIDKKIERFIAKHHVLTLATATPDGEPYCCNCFFACDKASAAFIFTSDASTHHAEMMQTNPRVAASVVLETRTVGKVQGLQITGKVLLTYHRSLESTEHCDECLELCRCIITMECNDI